MNIFRSRYLCLFCFVFIAICAVCVCFNGFVKLALCAALVFAAVVVCAIALLRKIKKSTAAVWLFAVCFAISAALLSYAAYDGYYGRMLEYVGEERSVKGVIIEENYANDYASSYIMRLESVDGINAEGDILIHCEYVSNLREGYEAEIFGEISPLDDAGVGYSEKEMYLDKAIIVKLTVSDENNCRITDENTHTLGLVFSQINSAVSYKLTEGIGKDAGTLASALLLGNKHLLPDNIRRDFGRCGVSHILALSGLHMTVIMGAVALVLKLLRMKRIFRCLLVSAVALSYLAVTGFSVSAARSVLMLLYVYLSYMLFADADGLTSLFVAAVVILIISPYSLFDLSYILSFLATFGIVVFAPSVNKAFSAVKTKSARKKGFATIAGKSVKYVVLSVSITLIASIATACVMWVYFGELSLLSPIYNLIVTPCSMFILILSPLYLITGAAGGVGEVFAVPIRAVADFSFATTEYGARQSGAMISLGYSFAGVIIVVTTVALALMCIIKLKRKWLFVALPALSAAVFCVCFAVSAKNNTDIMNVSCVSDGKNEMLVITSVSPRLGAGAVICDISDGSYSNFSDACVMATENNATEISVCMLTHYHQRHIRAAIMLFSRETVRCLWLPEPADEREYFIMLDLCDIAKKNGVGVSVYKDGDKLTVFGIGEISAHTDYIERSTHPTIAVSVGGKYERLTYTGASVYDSIYAKKGKSGQPIFGEKTKTAAFADSKSPKSDIIIFGTHGPIFKNSYSCQMPENPTTPTEIIFTTETAAAYFTLPDREYGREYIMRLKTGLFEIKLK